MIKLRDINAIYDVIDCEKVRYEEEFENEFGEQDIFEFISKFILLSPDAKGLNNVLIVKHYDNYIVEGSYEISSDVVNRMIKWDLVSENIDKGMIIISAVEGATSDITVLTGKNFDTIEECMKFMNTLNSMSYKYCKLENNKLVKLI